jgi:hypothetical protein
MSKQAHNHKPFIGIVVRMKIISMQTLWDLIFVRGNNRGEYEGLTVNYMWGLAHMCERSRIPFIQLC